MKKEKENPNHHMGKQTGYELINGEYHIAPMYCEQLDALMRRAGGIEDMLHIVTHHASVDLEQIRKDEKKVWDALSEDIGLEKGQAWIYRNGVVKKQEVKQ